MRHNRCRKKRRKGRRDEHKGAFEYCPKLIDKNGFTLFTDYLYQYLGDSEHVIIPNGVKTIGDSAFPYSTTIKSITIPDGVTTIGKYAFWTCSAGLESVMIPSSVTSIGRNAFAMCDKLTITAPKDSYAIGYAKENNIQYLEI